MKGSEELQRALEDARGFVASRGSRFDALFADALLGRAVPDELVAEIEAHQTGAGAIAPLPGGIHRSGVRARSSAAQASIASTADALLLLDAVRRLDSGGVPRIAHFLASVQEEDGSWADDPGTGPDERLVLTAAVCGNLARTTCVRGSVLMRGADYLASRWSEQRVRAGDYASIAASFHVFSQQPVEIADEALQWCGRELERGFRSGVFDAILTGRIFVLCDVAALPGSRIRGQEVAEALLASQEGDGGWPGGAPAERLEATLEALLIARRLSDHGTSAPGS